MITETNIGKRKRSFKKRLLWILGILIVVISIAAIFVYNNFNRLLSDALAKSFNSNIISNVYELKFEKLSVDLLGGNIRVYNVQLQPRQKPLQVYPYINSSFRLSAKKMLLANVQLYTLMKSNVLNLDRIEFVEPEVDLELNGNNPVLLPFEDTVGVAGKAETKDGKTIKSFSLKEFELVDASFHVLNSAKEREFRIDKLNISLNDLLIDPHPGKLNLLNKKLTLSIKEFSGTLKNGALKHIHFKDYKATIDSVNLQQTPDTSILHFADFSTGLKSLEIQTADSIFRLTMDAFDISSREKSIKLTNISFKPNISEAAMQKRFVYQNTQISGQVGRISLTGVNFDSLIYKQKIFIDELNLDKVSVVLFKDQAKPIDLKRYPKFLGQQIQAIDVPILIKHVKATGVDLTNTERTAEGSYRKVHINRATLDAKNITSLPTGEMLVLNADAYIENKAHANLTLRFSYTQPQFSINGKVQQFNLPDLNQLLSSYVPAGIKKGIVDDITFSGNAYNTEVTGTMKFLYHDLDVNLQLHEKAKWKSSVLSFAANAYLNSSNPASANEPPRTVQFHAERNMNKGFVNLLIKAVLSGVKETMIMSKENRKAFHAEKKEAKRKAKNERKNK